MAQSVFIVGILILSPDAQRSQHGLTVAGGNERGDYTNQLYWPRGLDIDDDDQSIVIADCWNHCIVEWKMGDKNGKVTVCGRG